MKKIIFTIVILAIITVNKNVYCQEIVRANCPHFIPSENCLQPANGETWIRITVDFSEIPEIEDTNWSVDFSVSDPSQYEKIAKSDFVDYGNGEFLLRNMYRFPIPNNAQSYGFALYLMSATNVLLATKEMSFNICDENNSNRLANSNHFNQSGTKKSSVEQLDLFENQKQNQQYSFKVYPNPIVSDFTLEYETKSNEAVVMQIFDIEGRSIYSAQVEHQHAGQYQKQFNGVDLAKGVYFINIEHEKFIQTLRLVKH